jgi:glutamine amidotransferase
VSDAREVGIIDYGVGNLLSVQRAFEKCGATVRLLHTADEVLAAPRLVLPGVGAFGDGMAGLHSRGLIDPIREYAASGRPLLGICLGMQMLFGVGEEYGTHEGLGLIPGRVVGIPPVSAGGLPHKIPHIGWNAIRGPGWQGTILEDLRQGESFYFVHSFMGVPRDGSARLADTDYNGQRILAVVRQRNVMGCQFHPEKSAGNGLALVGRFCRT